MEKLDRFKKEAHELKQEVSEKNSTILAKDLSITGLKSNLESVGSNAT